MITFPSLPPSLRMLILSISLSHSFLLLLDLIDDVGELLPEVRGLLVHRRHGEALQSPARTDQGWPTSSLTSRASTKHYNIQNINICGKSLEIV